ncbi:MAG: polyprenyl synthetase family protein, partial [Dehalococcoidia bacterium]
MSNAEAGASAIYSLVLDELARVEENLRRLARTGVPATTGPGDPHISELLEYVLDSKGKRIRPAITLLASRFHPHDGELPISMASAVELLHLATLIHDDTVDNSPVRRGRATVSQLWGRDTAVLLGDYVFATSAVFVCDTHSVHIIRRFSETIMEISSGELLESLSKYDTHQSRQQYEERIYRKTASLFQTAAESGAILSGAPEETVEALHTYGFNLGMAFQVVDDILDFEGDATEIGKPVGHDLLNGVLTLP